MIPQLQIRQTYGQLSIDADQGQFQMHLPQADVQMHTTQPFSTISKGEVFLSIDQNSGFSNVGTGNNLEWNKHIYSQMKNVLLQGILRRNKDGEEMARVSDPRPAIPYLADKNSKLINTIDYGDDQFPYVQFDPKVKPLEIDITPGKTDIEITPQKAQVAYERGKLEIGMLREPSINMFV